MTATVMTVRGPMPAAELGFTLTHEHPYCRLRQAPHRYDFPDQVEDDELIASEVGAFVALGGRSMVDLTTPQIGRQPAKLVALSERVGINIVMGCGWYRESYYLPEERLDQRQVDELADGLIAEIEGGVPVPGAAGGVVRPGVIGEIGSEKTWVTPIEERVLRAAARASRATGLSVGALHAIGPVAPQQLTILEDEGVDPARVAVGHCESMPYFDYLVALLRRGPYLVFDNCGQYRTLGQFEADILALLVRLIDAGWAHRLLLSHDTCKFPQFRRHGGPGLTYIPETFLPRLAALGVAPATITTITAENPARWLTGG
jgi:phosphotriesterase-related protein